MVGFELSPSERKKLRYLSSDEPVERRVTLKIADECEISIFVMVADNMIETGDNLKTPVSQWIRPTSFRREPARSHLGDSAHIQLSAVKLG